MVCRKANGITQSKSEESFEKPPGEPECQTERDRSEEIVHQIE